MLSAAAHVTNSGASNLTIALIGLCGILFGALLGYVGKSRELRLTRQGELRRLYADFLAARDSYDQIEQEELSARTHLGSFMEDIDVESQEEHDALPDETKDIWARLSDVHSEKRRARRIEQRKFRQALRQIEIQAPKDTHHAAWMYSGMSDFRMKYEADSLVMFVLLARRDLASVSQSFSLRREARSGMKVSWWRTSRGL